jgi:hypothetical protein
MVKRGNAEFVRSGEQSPGRVDVSALLVTYRLSKNPLVASVIA